MKIENIVEYVDIEGRSIDDLVMMLDAAKRGLGLANRLSGSSRKKHMSRVLGNLNRIRAALQRAIRDLDPVELNPEAPDFDPEARQF